MSMVRLAWATAELLRSRQVLKPPMRYWLTRQNMRLRAPFPQ